MIQTPASLREALWISEHASPQTLSDFEDTNMLRFLRTRVPAKDAVIFWRNHVPAMVFGWDKEEDEWFSWFLATEHGFTAGGTLALRRHLQSVQKDNPYIDLLCFQPRKSRPILRWFKALGCVPFNRTWRAGWVFQG